MKLNFKGGWKFESLIGSRTRQGAGGKARNNASTLVQRAITATTHPSTCPKIDVYKPSARVEASAPSHWMFNFGARSPGIGLDGRNMKRSRKEAFDLSTSYKNSSKAYQYLIFLFSPLSMSAERRCPPHPCHALTGSWAKCTCTANSGHSVLMSLPRSHRTWASCFSSVCVVLRYCTGLGRNEIWTSMLGQ